MQQLLSLTAQWCKPYLTEISFSVVATLLVLFGGRINGEIKKIISSYHSALRILIFTLVSGFGYGLAIVYLSDIMEKILRYKTGSYLGLIVIGIFLLLGILLDRKRSG